jgi:competence protein ComEC
MTGRVATAGAATAARTPDRRLAAPAIGAWASTAACTLLSPKTSVAIAAFASAVALLAGRRHGTVTLLALGVVLGAGCAAWHVHSLRHGIVPMMASRRADADVIARLVRDPAVVTTASGSRLTLIDATVTSVLARGWKSSDAPILILSYGTGWDGLLPGQRIEVVGRLAPPRRGDDVAAVLDARAPPTTIGQPPWWQRAAGTVRLALRRACGGLPADERGLLPGLVDGDIAAEPADLQADMKLTGLTHLQAVSGENVAVVLAVAVGVARAIGLRRRSRIAMSSIALVAFVVLARPSPSVLRAAVMGGIILLAMALGRRVAAIPVLSAAVLVLVCLDPFLARSVGFVLSVFATAGILLVAPGWTRRLARHMPVPLAAMVAVPAAAQLSCTPVLILAFGQLTPYAIPANLLAAPAVVPATVLGVLCAVLATVFAPLAVAVAWIAAVPTAVIPVVARTMASLPGAGLRWPGGAVTELTVGAAIVCIAVARSRRPRRDGSHAILGRWPP